MHLETIFRDAVHTCFIYIVQQKQSYKVKYMYATSIMIGERCVFNIFLKVSNE